MRIPTVCLLLLITAAAAARPIAITESARLHPPVPYEHVAVSISGDSLFMAAYADNELAIFLFTRQADGHWQYARKLFGTPGQPIGREWMAADDHVLAVLFDQALFVFEAVGTDWVRRPVVPPTEPIESSSLDVDQGRVLVGVGNCGPNSAVLAKNSAGAWEQVGHLTAEPRECINGSLHRAGALAGDLALSYQLAAAAHQRVYYYRNLPGVMEWSHFGSTADRPVTSDWVATDGVHGFVAADPKPSIYSSTLQRIGSLDFLDAAMYGSPQEFFARDGFVVLNQIPSYIGDAPQFSSLFVWRETSPDHFQHVAVAAHAKDATLLRGPDLSGRTLTAYDGDAVYVFDLPESFDSPPPQRYDFQQGGTGAWQPVAGSQLSVGVSGYSSVYRQSNLEGDTGAVLADADWTNQSIQADLKPVAFSGSDRWVGLVARWQDAENYYYVTLRSSNRVSLRRVVNGEVTELGSAALPVTLRKNYRVRLETRGNEIVASVDHAVRLSAFDAYLKHGTAGFHGYRARYEVDNVLVSPLATTLFRTRFQDEFAGDWQVHKGTWGFPAPDYDFTQSTTDQETFAAIGEPTDDQVVTARTRVKAFSSANTGAWAGVVARYTSYANHYSLVLRSANYVQLRKKVNGVVTVLRGRPFTVTPGQYYDLRLDATGNMLRGYIDGVLVLETTDTALPTGRAGLATYHAAASYTDFDASQP